MTHPRDLCKNKCSFLFPLCHYIYQLSFKDEPNYMRMRYYLEKVMMDMNCRPGRNFDWTVGQGESRVIVVPQAAQSDENRR